MNADFDNMNVGDYVMIANSVEIEDNAKLYTRGEQEWIFITDFSGATGIKGEKGDQRNTAEYKEYSGIQGIQGEKGNTGDTGNGILNIVKTSTSGLVDTYTITYTNGNTTTFDVTNGQDGEVTQEDLDAVIEENRKLRNDINNGTVTLTGSGENITINNTAEARIKDIQIKGNSSQNGTPSPTNKVPVLKVTGNSQVKIQNKNIFDGELELGVYSGSSGAKVQSNDYVRSKNYIRVDELTDYKIAKTGENISFYIYEYKGDFSYNLSSAKLINTSQYLTTNSETRYITFRTYSENTNTSMNIQIEKGSTITDYIEHKEQNKILNLGNIELLKLDTYQDYIYKKNNKWYKHNTIEKIILVGGSDEPWTRYPTPDGNQRYYMEDFLNAVADKGMSNYFVLGNFSDRNLEGQLNKFFIGGNKSIQVVSSEQTLADFKDLLNDIKPTFYYVPINPTNTEITDVTLINQLEGWLELMSYDTQTNIIGTSQESNPIFTVKLMGDINDLI